jgi:hypothetical protein
MRSCQVLGGTALSNDLPLFRPAISPVGADRASVMRCRRSLLAAGGRRCCCHRCCQPGSRERVTWRPFEAAIVRVRLALYLPWPISQHLAVRMAVIRSRALLSSRAYPASLGMLAVLGARTACEDEVPWGAVGEYGVGICLGESVAQCCTGTGRTFLQVGQDDPERA